MAGIVGKWHEIAIEGYPNAEEDEYGNIPDYLLTDGEDYFIGFWREDANAWDNFNSGWVRKYLTNEQTTDDNIAHITHWMELPKLPRTREQKIQALKDELKKCEGYIKTINENINIVDRTESGFTAEIKPLDLKDLFGDFKHHVDNMTDEEIVESVEQAICEAEDEMRDFTPEEEEVYQKSIEKLYKPIGVNIWGNFNEED